MTEHILGNIFIRPNKLAKAGDATHGHTHNFDHVTYVVFGAIHVKAMLPSGQIIERDFGAGCDAGHYCLIKAEVLHEITALVDDTEYHCVYAHRTPQGEVSQVNTGWQDAYE